LLEGEFGEKDKIIVDATPKGEVLFSKG